MSAAAQYRRLAVSCLQWAEATRDPVVREQLMRLARRYACMADQDSNDREAA